MNTKRSLSAITICLAFCTAFTSCKKDTEIVTPPVPNCKITVISITSGPVDIVYAIAYNEDGSKNTVTTGNVVTTFSYSGNTVIENETVAGAFSSKAIVTLNGAGFTVNRHTETNPSGTVWQNLAYEYNGTELSKSTFSSSALPTSVTTYTWTGGNVTSITANGSLSTLEYYSDKLTIPGDYFQLAQILTSGTIYKTRNALKSLTSGPIVVGFVYTYGADGKIGQLKMTSGGTESIYAYTYLCK
jgi:hypothetical protein